MADYIQFASPDGSTILVEVEEGEVTSQRIQKAGLREMASKTMAAAQTTFEEALDRVMRQTAQAFIQSVRSVPVLPNEAELTFGLKATGEIGNLAVAKAGGEANYTVKLTWRREEKGK